MRASACNVRRNRRERPAGAKWCGRRRNCRRRRSRSDLRRRSRRRGDCAGRRPWACRAERPAAAKAGGGSSRDSALFSARQSAPRRERREERAIRQRRTISHIRQVHEHASTNQERHCNSCVAVRANAVDCPTVAVIQNRFMFRTSRKSRGKSRETAPRNHSATLFSYAAGF